MKLFGLIDTSGTTTTNKINSMMAAMTSAITSAVENCSSSIDQSQESVTINYGASIGNTLHMEQTSEIDSECVLQQKVQTEVQNAISTALSQTANSNGVGLLSTLGGSSSNNEATVSSFISNNINNSSIMNSYNKIKQDQKSVNINYGLKAFDTESMKQGATIFAKAALSEVEKTGIIDDLKAQLDQTAIAKTTNPLDFITDIFKSLGTTTVLFFFIIAVVVISMGVFVYKFLSAGGSISPTGISGPPKKTEPAASG